MDPIGTAGLGGVTGSVPLRVFLSHTSDLGKHTEPGSFVAAAVEAVLRARHAVTDMAYFAAREVSPGTVCVEMVAQSDVYVGIIGLRYGSPVRDRSDVSYTELEFEAAGEHDQARLLFLIREDSAYLPRMRQPAGRRARQEAFRQRLRDSGLTIVRVGSPAELELAVYQALVELGPTPDAPARLAEAQALLASMPTDALPDRGPLPTGSRIPLAPNPLFVGRGDELLQAARALRGGDTTVALGQVVASTGLGGLGKTQLAVELVHRYGRFFAGGVYWLSFASADEIPLQVAACAGPGAMNLAPGIEDQPVETRVERVQRTWQSATPRLLVFDNCEEEALLEAWRPTSGGCRVLVTSRLSRWSPTLGVTALPLDLLPRPDSIELLRRYRPDLGLDDSDLNAIAEELGDLPLALHLAGSYLRAYRWEISLDDYLAELRGAEVVHHASLLGAGLDGLPSPTRHVQSVAQTFALCLGRLDRKREIDRVAIALLARMACMAPGEPVPRDLLSRTLEKAGARRRADGLRRLGAVGLLEEGDGWLRLHGLLVHFVRHMDLDAAAQVSVDQTLINYGKQASRGHRSGVELAAVVPHLIDAAGAASKEIRGDRLAPELCTAVGDALQQIGDFFGAKPWYQRALAIRERTLGPKHPDTAASLNELAGILSQQGELETALPLHQRSLLIREAVIGPDHLDTAASVNDLARTLHALGNLTRAESLFRRALAIHERTLGPDHPNTAVSLNNLALLLRDKGDMDAAKPMFERALSIRHHTLGSTHQSTAQSLNNLGLLLRDQGDLGTAKTLFEHALAVWEQVLGPEHPQIAFGLNNVAITARDQGQMEAAKALFERALAIRERTLGPEHPNTAFSLNNLGRLLHANGELDAARPLLERGLYIRERMLGSSHPQTADSLNNLALLLRDQGAVAAARPLFERAMAIWERLLDVRVSAECMGDHSRC